MMRASTDKSSAEKSDGQIVITNQKRVACEGSGGALGHPKIWLNIGPDDQIVCPYCSRQFVHDSQAA